MRFTKRDTYIVEFQYAEDNESVKVVSVENLKGEMAEIENKEEFKLTENRKFPDALFEYVASIVNEDPKAIKIHFNELSSD